MFWSGMLLLSYMTDIETHTKKKKQPNLPTHCKKKKKSRPTDLPTYPLLKHLSRQLQNKQFLRTAQSIKHTHSSTHLIIHSFFR